MKKNVLVFPCGSEIGLEIHKSLSFSTHFNLIGASSVDDHGKFAYKNYVGGLPHVKEDGFLQAINKVIDDNQVDYVIAAHDDAVVEFARAHEAGELHCEAVTSPLQTCEIARSKQKTYQTLSKVVKTPKLYKDVGDIKDVDWPVFLKPDIGQGSKGTHLANTKEEAEFYIKQDSSLLILENLPGKEYTIDCFTNKDGELQFCQSRQRNRISSGISVSSKRVQNPAFQEIGNKINQVLKFRGVWFFQLKEDNNGDLVLLEIAPRIAGTMGLTRGRGVNLVILSLFDAMGYDVDVFDGNYEMTIDRALTNKFKHNINYKHVYLDFDDLVVLDGKVNPFVMAFVYQCFNNDVQVHLITKHKDDIQKTLRKYKLDSVFSDVILLEKDDDKSKFITQKDAIFIDDSFAERKRVHEKCDIPVFDAHMIESLLETF